MHEWIRGKLFANFLTSLGKHVVAITWHCIYGWFQQLFFIIFILYHIRFIC